MCGWNGWGIEEDLTTRGADHHVAPKSVDVAIHHLSKIIGEGFVEAVRGDGVSVFI
jgi:hypothetical protein